MQIYSSSEIIMRRHLFRVFAAVVFSIISLFTLSCSYHPFIPDDPDNNILGMVTFDNRDPGEHYGNFDVRSDFGTLKSWGSWWPFWRMRIDSVSPVHNRVLAVRYPKRKLRSFKSGASWHWRPTEPRQEMFFSYWVLFPDSFEFRDGGKLHGLVGGKGNTGGNRSTGRDGWSCRVHWGAGDQIKLYVYHKDQSRKWGDTFYFTDDPQIHIVSPDKPVKQTEKHIHVERGVWHHIQMRVRVNDVGVRNGLAQAWYDGRLVTDIRGFEFRNAECRDDQLLVKGVYFSTFFGGRGEGYKPVRDETVYFDDFVVSRNLYRPPGLVYDPVP